MERVEIQSVRGPYRLIFSNRKPPTRARGAEYVTVELVGPDLAATRTQVYLYDPEPLVRLFDELAQNWRGWEGDKHWHSVESDLDLKCTSDRLGHITIAVTLRSGPYVEDWSVSAPVFLDAGSLDIIAQEMKAFLAG